MVPASAEAFAGEVACAALLLSQQVQGDVAEAGEVLGPVAWADAAIVLGEGDVRRPMRLVLERPVRRSSAYQNTSTD